MCLPARGLRLIGPGKFQVSVVNCFPVEIARDESLELSARILLVAISPTPSASANLCRVLSLDGGGAKGFYTLGVLKELEAMVGHPLSNHFSLIFGTSTGAIIAALLALGRSVDEIHQLYKEHVPTVMCNRNARGRSRALAHLAKIVFEGRTFADVKTGIGIVATRWDFEKPMIFKSGVEQAHGRHATFEPGFGGTIADAVRGSCSAYPFFERHTVKTGSGDTVELFDGGYCANNPTLYAIADAILALKRSPSDLRVVSVGVGVYPEPKRWKSWFAKRFWGVQLLQKTLNVNTVSNGPVANRSIQRYFDSPHQRHLRPPGDGNGPDGIRPDKAQPAIPARP